MLEGRGEKVGDAAADHQRRFGRYVPSNQPTNQPAESNERKKEHQRSLLSARHIKISNRDQFDQRRCIFSFYYYGQPSQEFLPNAQVSLIFLSSLFCLWEKYG
jgi:hypothetical protein